MITAWHISQTLDKMEQFIKFIESFDEKRSQLQRLLGLSQRIKKVGQQREIVNRQVSQLGKGFDGVNIKDNSGSRKQQQQQIYEAQLSKIQRQLNMKLSDCSLRIKKLKRQLQDQQQLSKVFIKAKRQSVIAQMDGVIVDKLNMLNIRVDQQANQLLLLNESEVLAVQSSSLQQQQSQQQQTKPTVYDSFLRQILQHTLSQSQQQHQQKISTQQVQLGSVKCRLNSLQDRKRKLAVRKLFMGSKHSQGQINSKKSSIVSSSIEQQNKSANQNYTNSNQKSKNNNDTRNSNNTITTKTNHNQSMGLIQSIMSMFSTAEQNSHSNNQSKTNNTKNYKDKEPLKNNSNHKTSISSLNILNTPPLINNNNNKTTSNWTNKLQTKSYQHSSSLPNIIFDDNKRLRVAQMLAQIYQFEQNIHIIVQQNIISKFQIITSKLNNLNDQVNSYIEELLRAGVYVYREILSSVNSNNNKITIINSKNNTHNQDEQIIKQLKNNKQIKFFLHFITLSHMHRHKLFTVLFTDVFFAIPVAINFIRKRLQKLFSEMCEFMGKNDDNNGQKQIVVIEQQLERVNIYAQYLIQGRLLMIRKMIQQVLAEYVGWLIEIMQSTQEKYFIESGSWSQQSQQWDERDNANFKLSWEEFNQQLRKICQIITLSSTNQPTRDCTLNCQQLSRLLSSPYLDKIRSQQQTLVVQSLLQTSCSINDTYGSKKNYILTQQQQERQYERSYYYQSMQSLYRNIAGKVTSVIGANNKNC